MLLTGALPRQGHIVELLKLCTGKTNLGPRNSRLGNWIVSRGAASVKESSMTGGEGTKKGAKKRSNESTNKFTNQKSIASFFGGGLKAGTGIENTAAKQPSITSFFANDEGSEKNGISKNYEDDEKPLPSASAPPPMPPVPSPQRKSTETASAVGSKFLEENAVSGGAEEPEPKVYLRRKRRLVAGADDDDELLSTPTAPSCPTLGAVAEEQNSAGLTGEDGEKAQGIDASIVAKIAEGGCDEKKRRRLYKTGDLSGGTASQIAADIMPFNTEGNCEGKAKVSGSLAGAGEVDDGSDDDVSGESGEECDLNDDVKSDLEDGGGAEAAAISAKSATKIRKRKAVAKRGGGTKAKKVEGVSDGLVALALKSKDYDAAGASTWKPGERVPFSYLAQALEGKF